VSTDCDPLYPDMADSHPRKFAGKCDGKTAKPRTVRTAVLPPVRISARYFRCDSRRIANSAIWGFSRAAPAIATHMRRTFLRA
jgi:hypothetical protein